MPVTTLQKVGRVLNLKLTMVDDKVKQKKFLDSIILYNYINELDLINSLDM
jgi:hypothetical protein